MLEFIIGRAGSGKTTACLNTIKEKFNPFTDRETSSYIIA